MYMSLLRVKTNTFDKCSLMFYIDHSQLAGYGQEPGLSILSESCDPRPSDQRVTPICSPRIHLPTSPVPRLPVHDLNIPEKGMYSSCYIMKINIAVYCSTTYYMYMYLVFLYFICKY